MLVAVLFWSLAILCCGFAALYGGRSGRCVAAAVIMAAAATPLVSHGNTWLAPNLGVLTVDTLLLIALIGIALRSDRWFPIWSAGLQLVGVTFHFASVLAPGFAPDIYFLLQALWAVPVLMLLAIGVALDRHAGIAMNRARDSAEKERRAAYLRTCDRLLQRLERSRCHLREILDRTEALIVQLPRRDVEQLLCWFDAVEDEEEDAVAVRAAVEDRIETLIACLDALEADCDLEDDDLDSDDLREADEIAA